MRIKQMMILPALCLSMMTTSCSTHSTETMPETTKKEVAIQLYSVVLSFAVCTVTGIFFGWYPAQKASNLDPIEAIRYE